MTYASQDFRGRVAELREAAQPCGDLQRVARPYFEAAEWETSTGKSIEQAVGMNNAVDMHMSVDRLVAHAKNCADCGHTACIFAGVERMTQEEILTLVEG